MAPVCLPGCVICVEIISSSVDEDGNVVAYVDACAFTSKANGVAPSTVTSSFIDKSEFTSTVVTQDASSSVVDIDQSDAPFLSVERIDATPACGSDIGEMFNLTGGESVLQDDLQISVDDSQASSNESLPIILDCVDKEPESIPNPLTAQSTGDVNVSVKNDAVSDIKAEPVPESAGEPSKESGGELNKEASQPEVVSLFGERGPSLLGEEVKPQAAADLPVTPIVQKTSGIEVVLTKERFYELLSAIDTSSAKRNEAASSASTMSREEAVKAEANGRIRTGFIAYVINKAKGQLVINDMKISVKHGDVINLGGLSADKLKDSADLFELLSANLLEFVAEDKVKAIREAAAKKIAALTKSQDDEIFDSPEDASMWRKRKPGARRKRSSDGRVRRAGEGDDSDDYDYDDSDEWDYEQAERVSVNMVPKRLMNRDIYVSPDEMNELDKVQVDIGVGSGASRFPEDL
jgi:hypothetical protein